jgi:hypothetical protein
MSRIAILNNTKTNEFQRRRIEELRRNEIDASTIWLHNAYKLVFPEWYRGFNLFLYKHGFRRLSGFLTPLFGVRTVYKSSIPIRIEVWKHGKLVAKNYEN